MLKSSICGVGDEEKHIYEPNESNLASPLLTIYGQLPWMYIAEAMSVSWTGRNHKESCVIKEKHTNRTPMYCPEWIFQMSLIPDDKMPF